MTGIACIAGICYTMSLFIGVVVFDDRDLMTRVRVGVLLGSILSAAAGTTLLTMAAARRSFTIRDAP
jgi:NhaA family Na+:H+ antiporter